MIFYAILSQKVRTSNALKQEYGRTATLLTNCPTFFDWLSMCEFYFVLNYTSQYLVILFLL